MHRLLFLLLLLFTGFSSSQEISLLGVCTDKKGTPIDNVKVIAKKAINPILYTDKNGAFNFTFNKLDRVDVEFRTSNLTKIKTIILKEGVNKLGEIRFSFLQQDEVDVKARQTDLFDLPELEVIDWQNLPMGSAERYLIYSTPATSNNELTTNYNVRGGSYDENLVYVNGFNIYRPFLTRSGQQEGMSFINSALVESLSFSGGGFDAQYGDKLSSVLDIKYKTPTVLHGSVMASLLGTEAHVEHAVNARLNYLVGARYRSNGYLLNALPTKGAYNPVFWDVQFLTNYAITENLTWSVIGHFSSNNYRFTPVSSETDFGTANEAYSFRVYFEGQEQTQFTTMMGGTSLKWEVNEKTNLDLYVTVFNTVEEESFDILAEYYINELETDPTQEEFGDSIAVLGVGSYLSHARNKLNANIINIYHNGSHTFKKGYKDEEKTRFQHHALKWGVNFQLDYFTDKLSEWKLVDSAGYAIPQSGTNEITLFESLKSDLNLYSQRYTGFIQFNSIWSKNERNKRVSVAKKYKIKKNGVKIKLEKTFTNTIVESPSKWALSIGARTGHTTANGEYFLTPRASIKYFPRAYMVKDEKVIRRDVSFYFSTGMYYQPPFYREFRTFSGNLNLDVKSQKSAHFVLGSDVYFGMWGREKPFKFTVEAYYKYLWDVNPYEIDNVRTRYYAINDAVAYAYGLDLNIHGQFVKGIESFFKLGLLSTKEDIKGDYYNEYYNAAGDKIIFGFSEDQTVVDTVTVNPGYIPRPTDQWLNFGALIQDRMPIYESFTVQMGMQFGTPLPYGPPDFERYKDTLRLRSYFRVDIGTSYDFFYKKRAHETFWNKNFTDLIVSFEVFNLLGINNVLSKQWVQDTQGKYYAIPNNLTARRFNLKIIARL
ncbi:MAG: TonB-dependent receptor plug domain-containing protein [Crocinitomicaceae bacterium]